jgi:tRNA-2-methylthio-N6-dimethylallyladenosine synthase
VRCPRVALSTDIIVGFPGETEVEFAATLELLEQVKYDEIFSFTYSPRSQTVSAKLYDDDIPDGIKKERLTRVQSLQREITLRKNRQRIAQRSDHGTHALKSHRQCVWAGETDGRSADGLHHRRHRHLADRRAGGGRCCF